MLCLISVESRVPQDHPLRPVKALADAALKRLSPVFDAMYADNGRPSVPPERLLKGMLLIALYSVRSERQFCEQLEYNLLFRWFLDMDMLEEAFDASTFSRNRERLMEHTKVGAPFMPARLPTLPPKPTPVTRRYDARPGAKRRRGVSRKHPLDQRLRTVGGIP